MFFFFFIYTFHLIINTNNCQDVQEKLRLEAKSDVAMDKRSYLASVIYEVLRMYPPISQLVNRKTSARILIGEKLVIPKNTYVGYICYGTGRDPQIWGLDADKFMPERWGSSIEEIRAKYLSAKSSCKLITFHGGPRACLGERLALAETKILLTEMLNSVSWILDPEWHEMMTPGGPLSPLMMRLKIKAVD